MKHQTLIAVAILVAGAAVAAIVTRIQTAGSSTSSPTRDLPTSRGEPVLVSVNDLMRDVNRYRGVPLCVDGVVSATFPTKRTLALIDRSEFEQCGLGCAELTLPVRWSGSMPAAQSAVRIDGEIAREGARLVFVARAVEGLELRESR